MLKPRMNNPCPQDYNSMTSAENGRFCAQCCKVVVDFTQKTAEEIFEYIKTNTGTCGRFLRSQLQPMPVPAGPVQKVSGRFRRFTTAVFLVFGALLFSAQTACGGQIDYHMDDSIRMADSLYAAGMGALNDSAGLAQAAYDAAMDRHHESLTTALKDSIKKADAAKKGKP